MKITEWALYPFESAVSRLLASPTPRKAPALRLAHLRLISSQTRVPGGDRIFNQIHLKSVMADVVVR